MTLVPKTPMPAVNLLDLKTISDQLAATIKNREDILLHCELASVDIHKAKLAKYKAQKSDIDGQISSPKPTQK